MTHVRFTVAGIPTAKGRPKFVRQTGRTYTPAETQRAENNFGQEAALAMRGRPLLTGAVEVELAFVFPWPKSVTKKRRADPNGKYKETKPDIDNCIKLVKDAMNGIVYRDDGCIAKISAVKLFGDRAETVVLVRPIETGLLAPERPASEPRREERQEALL